MTMYDALENNNVTTEVCAVVRGSVTLDRTVVVMIQTRDGSAVGEKILGKGLPIEIGKGFLFV